MIKEGYIVLNGNMKKSYIINDRYYVFDIGEVRGEKALISMEEVESKWVFNWTKEVITLPQTWEEAGKYINNCTWTEDEFWACEKCGLYTPVDEQVFNDDEQRYICPNCINELNKKW
jgi:hypothetical protein